MINETFLGMKRATEFLSKNLDNCRTPVRKMRRLRSGDSFRTLELMVLSIPSRMWRTKMGSNPKEPIFHRHPKILDPDQPRCEFFNSFQPRTERIERGCRIIFIKLQGSGVFIFVYICTIFNKCDVYNSVVYSTQLRNASVTHGRLESEDDH